MGRRKKFKTKTKQNAKCNKWKKSPCNDFNRVLEPRQDITQYEDKSVSIHLKERNKASKINTLLPSILAFKEQLEFAQVG